MKEPQNNDINDILHETKAQIGKIDKYKYNQKGKWKKKKQQLKAMIISRRKRYIRKATVTKNQYQPKILDHERKPTGYYYTSKHFLT